MQYGTRLYYISQAIVPHSQHTHTHTPHHGHDQALHNIRGHVQDHATYHAAHHSKKQQLSI